MGLGAACLEHAALVLAHCEKPAALVEWELGVRVRVRVRSLVITRNQAHWVGIL